MTATLIDPFTGTVRGLDDPHPARAALRAAGPIVEVAAPAGGSAWIVTDEELARAVLIDPRIVKDTAWAPVDWDPRVAELEPTAADQTSLTTLDGPEHALLRRAHAPLLRTRRMRAHAGRIAAIAREELTALAATGGPVDLMAEFSGRYPLAVLCDLLGVPADLVEEGVAACRGMFAETPEEAGAAMGMFARLAAAALTDDRDGLAVELRDRMPGGITEPELHYLLFALLFAGQLTTDASLGFVVADLLSSDEFAGVDEILRVHPPAPFTLWRFTAEDVELAGVRLPARSPVLVDVLGINTAPGHSGTDLTFGGGAHRCVGAQLAHLELTVLVDVLREEFPGARLAVPRADLRQADRDGIGASRILELPVHLA